MIHTPRSTRSPLLSTLAPLALLAPPAVAQQATALDANPGSANSAPQELVASGGDIYFTANRGSGLELFRYDPDLETFAGIATGGCRFLSPGANGALYFACSQSGPQELWVVRPGQAPTRLTNIGSGAAVEDVTAAGGRVFFTARDGVNGRELWVYQQGSAALVRDIRPGNTGSGVGNMTAFGNRVVFAANDGTFGSEPWISDGTAAGTLRLGDIDPGNDSSNAEGFTAIGSLVYFGAKDGGLAVGRELWVTDGTVAGTQVFDVSPGTRASNPDSLTAAGGDLYFTATPSASVGRELFALRPGQQPALVANLNGGAAADPDALTWTGSRLYFRARTGTGRELWRYDPTQPVALGNPGVVVDFRGNSSGMTEARIAAAGPAFPDGVVFVANDGTSGNEVWLESGRPGVAPALVADINPTGASSGSSNPTDLLVDRDTVFCIANDQLLFGREVYRASLAVSGLAVWGTFGGPCPGSNGVGLTLDALNLPRLNSSFTLELTGLVPGALGVFVGSPNSRRVGAQSCAVYLNLQNAHPTAWLIADGNGRISTTIPIPGIASLVGYRVFFQGASYDPGAGFRNLASLSNGGFAVVGR